MTEEQNKIIEELYLEMHTSLCIYAVSTLRDRDLAEEAVQDTFRVACTRPNELLSSPNPRGWLVNTLKNVMRNISRSRSRLNRMVVTAISVEDVSVPAPQKDPDLYLTCARVLSREEYKLFRLVAIEGYTLLEASKVFGITLEACKKRIQRAKKRLRKALEDSR